MYARKVGERTLTLGVSGQLWRDVLVLYDRETDSRWTQLSGKAIDGPLTGAALQEIPSEVTTWAEWKARHKHTAVLKKTEPVGPAYMGYAANRDMLGILGTQNPDRRLPGKELVFGVSLPGGRAVAAVASRLEQEGALMIRAGEEAVLLAVSPSGGVLAHLLPPGTQAVERLGKTKWKLDGSVVDILTGKVLKGPGRGQTLQRVAVKRSYWFAWVAFYPGSEIVGL